jgi:hypothetical protein
VTLKTKTFVPRSFPIEGIEVKADNIEEVAKWCFGDVRSGSKKKEGPVEKYIKIRVYRLQDKSESRAFVGDTILYFASGFKVFTRAQFEKSYQPV